MRPPPIAGRSRGLPRGRRRRRRRRGGCPSRRFPLGGGGQPARSRIDRASPAVSSSLVAGPGASSAPVTNPARGGVRLSQRACRVASIIRAISSGWRRWAMSMRGGSAGSAERRRTEPRERTASTPATMPNTPPAGLAASSNGPAAKRCRSGGAARVGQGRAQGEHHLEAGLGKAGRGGQVHGGQRVVDQVVPDPGQDPHLRQVVAQATEAAGAGRSPGRAAARCQPRSCWPGSRAGWESPARTACGLLAEFVGPGRGGVLAAQRGTVIRRIWPSPGAGPPKPRLDTYSAPSGPRVIAVGNDSPVAITA